VRGKREVRGDLRALQRLQRAYTDVTAPAHIKMVKSAPCTAMSHRRGSSAVVGIFTVSYRLRRLSRKMRFLRAVSSARPRPDRCEDLWVLGLDVAAHHEKRNCADSSVAGARDKDDLAQCGVGMAHRSWRTFSSARPRSRRRVTADNPVGRRLMRVEPDNVIASGDVGWCRIFGTNGDAVADFVVSKKGGPGWCTFNTLEFRKGGPVSFFGRMAISVRSRSTMMR
jgi:hypothetical protein